MLEKRNTKDGYGTKRDHKTGTILAFVLGRRQDRVFLKLKKLLKPFGITLILYG